MRKLILSAATLGLVLVAPTTVFGATELARGVLRDSSGQPAQEP